MSISLRLYRGLSGFESLRTEWESFARSHGRHFLHFPAWYGAELDRAGDEGVFFLALRDAAGGLIAILPLQRCKVRVLGVPVPIVQLYYMSEMGVNEVLSREPLRQHRQAIHDLLRRELPFSLFIRWQCVLENGHAISATLPDEQVRYTHDSKFLDFAGGYDAFMRAMSSKLRSDLTKKARRLGQRADCRLDFVTAPSALRDAFDVFLDVEDSCWKGRSGTSIRKQASKQAYYRHLLEHFGQLGLCRINLLYCGDVAVAAQFGIEVGDCLYLLKIGFREEYGEFSPGALLMQQNVAHYCADTPVRRISFVTGASWCHRWHPSAVRVGVFYTDCETWLSRGAVRLLEWRMRWRCRKTPVDTVSAVPGIGGQWSMIVPPQREPIVGPTTRPARSSPPPSE